MLYLFAILFVSATFGKGGGKGGKGSGKGGSRGKGSRCELSVDEQNNYLDTVLAPFTVAGSDDPDSTTCEMKLASSWPHTDAVGATRRLLGGDSTEVTFDVTGTAVSQLQVTAADETTTCLTTTSFSVTNVEVFYAVEVEESMAEEIVADEDCDKESDSEEATDGDATEEVTEDVADEEAPEEDATGDDGLIGLRRNLGDSNRAYAVLTLTQTNSDVSVSFDLTVRCMVDYSRDGDVCTPAGIACERGDYTYNAAGEGAEVEAVAANFYMRCEADDSSDICPVA